MLLAEVTDIVGGGLVGGIIVAAGVAAARVLPIWFQGKASLAFSEEQKKSLSDKIAELSSDVGDLKGKLDKVEKAHHKCEERSAKQDMAIRLLVNRAVALDKILEDLGVDTSSLRGGTTHEDATNAGSGPKAEKGP